jgi:hypothetical protein
MSNNLPIWSDRFKDNYYHSIIAQLEQIIDECDDPSILSKIGTTLKNGLGGRAINKSRELYKNVQLSKVQN